MQSNEIPKSRAIDLKWVFKMAWRDSRKNRSRLLLFIASIVLGIAAIVAVYAFRDNLQRDIDDQAKTLAGADLILESRQPANPETEKIIANLGDEKAAERTFVSMLYFSKSGNSRLGQVRALEGNYPFYGPIETSPAAAEKNFRNERQALVDQTLMLQFGVKPGDSIRVGNLSFQIAGALKKAPGQTGIVSAVNPVVYIPMKYLEQTGLSKTGSRIQYKYYFKYNQPAQLAKVLKQLEPKLEKEGMEVQTVASTKENTGKSFKNVSRFLALSGFIALLLGCIGVGSAIQVYIREKLTSIATLRCLGVKSSEAFLIYLIQIAGIGLLGSVIGAILGTVIQFLLPYLLKDFIPVELTMNISWYAIGQGIAVGLIIAILFAMPSLLTVRLVSPLNALRLSFEKTTGKRDPLKGLVYLLIFGFVLGFTYLQMESWTMAAVFTLSVVLAFVLLFALSRVMMFILRKVLSGPLGYLWRQGFANLYRPNNQTLMLTVSIGLSTAFIATLFFVQGILLNRLSLSSGPNQANMVMFDIQTSQAKALINLVKTYKLPVLSQVPIVTVRLEKINGKKPIANRSAFNGELRVTFQEKLTSAETLVGGKWTGIAKPDGPIYVSLEEGYAKRLKVKIGDQILFNVQGMPINTIVGSLRSVNWAQMQTNFRVVFPKGVLEEAPQFQVITTHVPNQQRSAEVQTAVVAAFPNISVIDLGLVLSVLDELFSKIGFVIQFMAAFSMATGWIVLISAVLTSKGQRLKESVLLRTLGASRKQILSITAIEYLFLGSLSAATGLLLALSGSWALAAFVFDAPFTPSLIPIVLLFGSITSLVVITGVWSSRGMLSQPPLAVLRKDL